MYIGLYGFGAINQLVAREAVRRGHEVVGAVDIRPDLLGRDIGEIIGLGEKLGVKVSRDPESLLEADVVIHATSSYLDKVYDQLKTLIDLGLDVVSTCETLAYPYYRYPVLALWLDQEAGGRGVSVIGTGINPGFLLDTLPVILSIPFNEVRRIEAKRIVDASRRRRSFQVKIGIGLDPEEFKAKLKKGELTGHVGYAESVLLIAEASRVKLSRIEEGQEAVVAEKPVEFNGRMIPAGRVIGIKGWGRGFVNDKEILSLGFEAYLGAVEGEEIRITGKDYTVTWKSTGTPGDMGTVAVLLNIAENTPSYPAGLLTMVDLLPFKPRIKPI